MCLRHQCMCGGRGGGEVVGGGGVVWVNPGFN